MDFTWADIVTGLVSGDDLSPAATRWAMSEILTGNASQVQMAGFMVALRAKGESVAEIEALADEMLAKATPIDLPGDAVDVVGSGGDRANTVNISTMAALVAAAAGARVIKHGNRAASSLSGTADCLEALGVNISVPPSRQAQILDECGLVFLFAPLYHSSLRHIAPTRRELGIQTTFNFLGPLANPARPQAQAIGVADPQMAALVAGVLARRGSRGLVFHGEDGLDEMTTTTASMVWLVRDGRIITDMTNPADLGLAPAGVQDLVGGDPAYNAQVVREVLGGGPGAIRDIVLLNTAATLLAFDGPDLDSPLTGQLATALERAAAAIDSGRAGEILERWIAATQNAGRG